MTCRVTDQFQRPNTGLTISTEGIAMLGINISYRINLPFKFGLNNKNRKTGENVNKKNNDFYSILDWLGIPLTAFFYILAVALVIAGCLSSTGCGGGVGDDDTSNCSTTNCPDNADAGSDVDADDTTPDADTTPDGNTAGSCADYTGVPSDGWQCNPNNGNPTYDMNGLTFVVEDGACRLHSDSFWCQDLPSATDVQTGQFSCTDINDYFITCWHN